MLMTFGIILAIAGYLGEVAILGQRSDVDKFLGIVPKKIQDSWYTAACVKALGIILIIVSLCILAYRYLP